jgi:hypothetical protein
MDPHGADPDAHDEPAPIAGRNDTGGPWSTAWALVALALIGLMTVHACVPRAQAAVTAAPIHGAPAAR